MWRRSYGIDELVGDFKVDTDLKDLMKDLDGSRCHFSLWIEMSMTASRGSSILDCTSSLLESPTSFSNSDLLPQQQPGWEPSFANILLLLIKALPVVFPRGFN